MCGETLRTQMCVKSHPGAWHLCSLGTQNLELSWSSERQSLFFKTIESLQLPRSATSFYMAAGHLCYYWKTPRSVLTDSLPKVFKTPIRLSADKKFPIRNVHFLLKCSWRKQGPSSLCCYPVVRALAGKWEFLGSIHTASPTITLDWEEEEQEGNGESPPLYLKL